MRRQSVGPSARTRRDIVPKRQSTAARKARAVQRATGGKHTVLLAEQAVCGARLDPFLVYPGICARPPHPEEEPCSANRDFDAVAWKARVQQEWDAEEARRAALTDEERAEEERLAFEEGYDDGRTASEEWEDVRSYKWED